MLTMAAFFCGDLSNMGYFNPAIVIGVLVQQYDHELAKFSKGFIGILENIKFAGIVIAMQLMGSIFGLLLWKQAVYLPPDENDIGIAIMCPAPNMKDMAFTPADLYDDCALVDNRKDLCKIKA